MKIEIISLSKNYNNKQALKNVNLKIEKGMFGLLGPNGAGKTTLMKVLTTLIKKTSGEVELCGIPINNGKEIRKIIGYLPQDFAMYGNMSVYEALDYLAVLSGMSKNMRNEKVNETLKKVNLYTNRKIKVKAMSGGMKRRLGIAQAIIHNPKVIIVDEPTAGLDPEERVRFRNLLCEIASDSIVVLSTHIVEDVEATCEKLAILDEGKIVFFGNTSDLLKMVENNVYQAEISTNDLTEVKKKFLVTGILTKGSKTEIKVISESVPLDNAKKCHGNMEDAYLFLMKKRVEV